MGSNIPNFSSLSMIDTMGHTTVHRGVGLDINNVTKVIVDQVSAQVRVSMLPEPLRKLVPSLPSKSVCAWHLDACVTMCKQNRDVWKRQRVYICIKS